VCGGELIIGDFVSIACGARILTGTDNYFGGKRMSTVLSEEQRSVIRGQVVIEKDAFIGTNAVIQPNVTYLCIEPCKKIGERPRVVVEDI
jgi:UDP-3-O-[3-hydroxymyristoyl] glucosamine N-acyltransferase